jgi:hypothetical protein
VAIPTTTDMCARLENGSSAHSDEASADNKRPA